MIPASVRLLLFSTMLLLTSCMTFPPPTQNELSKADFGPYPDNYEKIVTAFASKEFKEPPTAQYTFVKRPSKTWLFRHTYYQYGWGVCYVINEKNSQGLVEEIYYFALINDGTVVEYELETDDLSRMAYARALCDRLK